MRTLDSLVAQVEPDSLARERQEIAAEAVLGGLEGKSRVLEGDHPPVPYRIHGPPPGGPGPFPVVLALHGAGGNEHMFLEAYGAGRLRELAEARGFVVIAPSTSSLARAPGALAGLLDAAGAEYLIDRARVSALGHSMGAGVAWQLAEGFPGALAAVACIAGPCGRTAGEAGGGAPVPMPPLLVIAGEADPIGLPSRLEAAVAQGRAQGVDVEYRVMPGLGHTLVVGAVLDEVVDWLLTRSHGSTTGRTSGSGR
jgi:pimeloyl-ACP methyl ester carboxylesterase